MEDDPSFRNKVQHYKPEDEEEEQQEKVEEEEEEEDSTLSNERA